MAADLTSTIETAAQNPKAVSVDGAHVEAHNLDDLIKADQYLGGKDAAAKPHFGLRFSKIIPPAGG